MHSLREIDKHAKLTDKIKNIAKKEEKLKK
jgi:hypothetical protein